MPSRVTPNATASLVADEQESREALRRKLGFRAWRRGTCEADLLIGAFADQFLAEFAEDELRQFELLLEEDDPVIDDWVAGRRLVPKEHDNRMMMLLREFRPLYPNRRE